jgi:hypothetical protein
MVTTSSQRGFQVPTNFGDTNVWGPELNFTLAALDAILGGSVTFPSSTYGTAATLSSSQAQCGLINLTGAAAGTFTLTLPSSNFALGFYAINNAFTSSYGTVCTNGSGPTVTVPAGQVDEILSIGTAVVSMSDGGTF